MEGLVFGFSVMLGWYVASYGIKRRWPVYKSMGYTLMLLYSAVATGYGLSWLAAKIFL